MTLSTSHSWEFILRRFQNFAPAKTLDANDQIKVTGARWCYTFKGIQPLSLSWTRSKEHSVFTVSGLRWGISFHDPAEACGMLMKLYWQGR